MKRRTRPRRLDYAADIPFAVGIRPLEPKHRPSLLAWLRGMRPRCNHGFARR